VKLILDMNLSPRWEATLRAHGLDATHWSRIGLPTATDAAILKHARDLGAIVMTQDLDFSAILAAWDATGPSVVVIRLGDVRPERVSRQVIAALRLADADLRSGALLTIDAGRQRVTVLPLRR
jgi:predicted nuclease of predicted toxin-antitoxin system